MTAIRKLAERVRWRWVLPLGMVAITFALVSIATLEYRKPDCPMYRYDAPGDMEPFSLLLARTLNGPAFSWFLPTLRYGAFIGTLLTSVTWLPEILVFWFVVGIAAESKLRRPGQWLIKRTWARAIVFITLLCICLLLLYRQMWLVRPAYTLMFLWPEFHVLGWWTPGLSVLPTTAWSLLGVAYFSVKLWSTFGHFRPAPTTD